MQINQSSYTNQHPDPDDSVHQSVTETSFDFSNQIDSNRKPKTERLLPESTENDDSADKSAAETSFNSSNLQFESNRKPRTELLSPESIASPENGDSVDQSQQLIPKSPETDDFVDQSEAEISVGLNHLQIEANEDLKSQQMTSESPEHDDEDEDDEGDFTFMCIGDSDSPTKLFEFSQIRFPLFDQSLLSTGDNRLPITVPVDNVFIESPRRSNGETTEVPTGTFCAISKESESGSPEINIKSNSTGFSKLWRFRDNMNRSNSDGRDAFVFFQTDNNRATSSSSNGKVNAVKNVDVKVDGKLTKKVVKKGKKKVKSAHEVYLKQKGGKTEEERRRSYLPYRPGLMGFFTNVNGGLSKNVHPF